MYDYFNVLPLYQKILCNINSCSARIVNAIIGMMNSKDHLPTYLLLVPDKDLVTWFSHFNFGISKIIQLNLNDIMNDVDRILRTRRENLIQTQPGAAAECTKVIWVKMLQRPYISTPDGHG